MGKTMVDDYDRMCSSANLQRAYRWTQSNPDAFYKGHFRDTYTAYAAASKLHLSRLRRVLARKAFRPSHASKLYFPKPSGLLRTFSLLSVDDQIVYQACVNIIADKLKPLVKSRYNKSIFGHLYAGKSSLFFYLKWQDGYRAFGQQIVAHVESGHRFVANFDLTAFYDSIDHRVLRHFLQDIEVDADLIDFLMSGLVVWTSSTWPNGEEPIYHGHGIPQGPLPSGLLAEALLKYLDDKGIQSGARYLRYVDDIKIFAKTEHQLRQRLVGLDLASKEVGLFPQSSKVAISEVKNPYEQIKSVSHPPEPSLRPKANQEKLRKRLLELTRRGRVSDDTKTRFKYLLGNAQPHSQLNLRLLKVLEHQPALSTNISNYIAKYPKLPQQFGATLVQVIKEQHIYHAVAADLLRASLMNLAGKPRIDCAAYCETRLFNPPAKSEPLQGSLRAALWAWILKEGRVTYARTREGLEQEHDPWVVKEIVMHLRVDAFGPASHEELLNISLRSQHPDVSRCSALRLVEDKLAVTGEERTIPESAKPILFSAAKIRRIGQPESLIHIALSQVLAQNFGALNWQKFLGPGHHVQAEHIAFAVRSYFESSIDSCILSLDSLCDLISEVSGNFAKTAI
ncbi:MAG: RNA-directed DNA polymerase [Gammaproteobacteria bacterium]